MACSVTLSGLVRDCSTSMGGIVEAYIANYDDVTSKTVTDGQISTIALQPGNTSFAIRLGRGRAA